MTNIGGEADMTKVEVGQRWESVNSGYIYRVLRSCPNYANAWRVFSEERQSEQQCSFKFDGSGGRYTLISSPPPADEPAQGATDDFVDPPPDGSHLGPTCGNRGRRHFWAPGAPGHEICLDCKLTRPDPSLPDPAFDVPSRRVRALSRWRLSHGGEDPTVASMWRGW